MSSKSAPVQGDASTGRKCEGKKPPHECFRCDKEYSRPHKRLIHMRDCCPDLLETCPTCETGYTNWNGVKVHHARQHGESLSKTDIYCERCGDFYKRVYKSSADSYSICDDCRPKVKSERMSGEANPQYGTGEVIEYDCKYCGEHNSQLKSDSGKGIFCDMDCRDAYQRGEKHPSYNGGKEHYYGPNWEEQRRKCLERDNYLCQDCGVPNKDAPIALNAHHIQPYKTFNSRERANRVENLVALCLSCHKKWEGIPVRPKLL